MICESRLICVSRQTQTETLSKPNQGVLHSIPAGFMELMHDLFPQYYTLATSKYDPLLQLSVGAVG